MRCSENWWDEQRIHQYLDLPHSVCSLPAEKLVEEVILVETNKIIKVPDLDFGDFLRFIGIWLLMTSKPGTNWADYFSENSIDILVGAQFVSTSLCLAIVLKVSALLPSSLPPPPSY